jgi:hypothetical protein
MMDLIVAFRDRETALACYDLFQPHITDSGATGTGVVFLSGSLNWPLGRLTALLGRTDEALGHYATAASVNTPGLAPGPSSPWPSWAGPKRSERARPLMTTRRRGCSPSRPRRGPGGWDMPGPADRAQHLVHELERAIRAGDPLTPREREIAGLVSAGLTNRAIGDAGAV